MANNDLRGDRLKDLEMIEAGRKLMPGLPVIARLDGRAFHTLTRGMERPFDFRLISCMDKTTSELVDKFRPILGYTQSDEITLIWREPLDFDGRIQKMCSILASAATCTFVRAFDAMFPDRQASLPQFDCRIFQVPNLGVAVDVLRWREDDAVRNSVSMVAQANFSHKELQKKSTRDMKTMLEGKGVVWGNLADHLKRGSYFQRQKYSKLLTDFERMAIPEKFRPEQGQSVDRTHVVRMDIKRLSVMDDWVAQDTLFGEDS